MKKFLVSLLIITAMLLPACADIAENAVSSIQGDNSDVDDMSDITLVPSVGASLFMRDTQIELPTGVSYSFEIRDGFRDLLSQYYGLQSNGKGVACYVWTESGELKFGIKNLTDIESPEDVVKTLPAATLGEIRAVLNSYSLNSRQKMTVCPIEEELCGYEYELLYMLGIGENCIEYTVSLGSYKFDVPFYGAEATELYNTLEELRRNSGQDSGIIAGAGDGELPAVSISFAPAGSLDFRGGVFGGYGSYSFRPDGKVSYIQSLASSLSEQFTVAEEQYGKLYALVTEGLKGKGVKYPFVEADELWCSIRTGLYSNKQIIIGERVTEILTLAEQMSKKASVVSDERDTDSDDYNTAIYLEFYNGNMEIESEFTVYSDEYCGLLTPSPFIERRYGILPEGSYAEILEFISGESAYFECKVSFGLTAGGELTLLGKPAKELFDVLSDAKANSREATEKERQKHGTLYDSAVDSSAQNSLAIHVSFTSLPDEYAGSDELSPWDSLVIPWFDVWPDEYALWSPSMMMSYMPTPIILPEGTYNRIYAIVEAANDVNGTTVSEYYSRDGIDELLTLLDEKGIKTENSASFYNVTPERVKAKTDYKIFKDMSEYTSYVVADGGVYVVCNSFGGSGFHDAVPCDFDENTVADLLVTASWGSGLHREELSLFNMTDKSTTVLFSTADSAFLLKEYYGWTLVIDIKTDENGNERYIVKALEISPVSSQKPETVDIGEVVAKDGKAVFVAYNEE